MYISIVLGMVNYMSLYSFVGKEVEVDHKISGLEILVKEVLFEKWELV